MKLLSYLEKKKETWYLIFFGFLFFILRLPSVFEPYWYGDEGIYETLGYGLRHGRILYQTIWDNKPPLLYWIYAIFNGDQSSVKFLSLIFGLLSFVAFFFLTRKIFGSKNNKVSLASSILFLFLFATPILEGNIGNAENFMLLPIILSAFIIYSFSENKDRGEITNYKPLVLAGILLGVSFLIKVVAIFDFASFLLFLFLIEFEKFKQIKKILYQLVFFTLSFISPFILISLYFAIKGNFLEFIKSAFFSNISYVNYGNQFIIPQGFLILKLILLLTVCVFIFLKKNLFSKKEIFITLWFSFSLFSAFFSQRPYTHYLLVLISSAILAFSLILEIGLKKKIFIYFFTIAIITTIITFSSSINFYKSTFGYYLNFIKFEIGSENLDQYIKFFDPNAFLNFQIAQYLNLNKTKNNSLFIWGNNAQLYKMTNTLPPGKFTVLYHITASQKNIEETKKEFLKGKSNFVVILQTEPKFPFSLLGYTQKMIMNNAYIYEKNY